MIYVTLPFDAATLVYALGPLLLLILNINAAPVRSTAAAAIIIAFFIAYAPFY